MLPEANHNQVVAFDGPFAGGGGGADLFRDRADDVDAGRLALVLLRVAPTSPSSWPASGGWR